MDRDFTDVHCHIIPDVDDGSPNIETSLRMVDEAYDEGIRRMIATPHFGIINPQYDPERVKKNYDELVRAVAGIHPDMKLYLGNEIFLVPGYSDGLKDGLSNTLAGSSYVLVEFPDDANYDMLYHEFRRIMLNGYTPVFAHAERYIYAYGDIKGLKSLRDQGVLVQVNSNSICSGRKPSGGIRKLLGMMDAWEEVEYFVHDILKAGLVDLVGTDCHDMPGRQPRMRLAAAKMVELIGESAAKKILIDNPQQILNQQ